MSSNVGTRRLVVGAHYGLRDWLAQRITAIVLAVYSLALGLYALVQHDLGYEGWAGLFAQTWVKVATLLALIALVYHVWIGVRDIWMDYIKPAGLRLALQVVTILWLAGCLLWAVLILWRV